MLRCGEWQYNVTIDTLYASYVTLRSTHRIQGAETMTSTTEISAKFGFESKFVEVHGSRMHYVDVGEGDPILFLHGNPTSSYLWRNVIPYLSEQGRCIAPDLIGMGKSDHPELSYRYDDQYRYLTGFTDALGIDSNVTLVLHDWGSGLGFRWAHENQDSVKGIAFMEAMIRLFSWDRMPVDARVAIRMMRTPGLGWLMASVGNIFIKKMLPDMVHRDLDPAAYEYYASAFPTVSSRKAVRQWPREIPIDGKPSRNATSIGAYAEWLTRTELPKILFHASPGTAITETEVAWCKENMANLQTVDIGEGLHFIQEDNPDMIGAELSSWYASL
jgi:haloalkane dehalogenase